MSGRSARNAVVVEAEAGQHALAVVLHHRVGGAHQPQQQLDALGAGQVERDAGLVAVDPVEIERLLVAERGDGLVAVVGAAPPVGIAAALDLDHLGAEVGELAGADRPGPAHGQVDDRAGPPAAARRPRRAPAAAAAAKAASVSVCSPASGATPSAVGGVAVRLLRQHRRLEAGLADPHLAERAVVAVHRAWPAASPCRASTTSGTRRAIASSAHSRAVRLASCVGR